MNRLLWRILKQCDYRPKTAIVMPWLGVGVLLEETEGRAAAALERSVKHGASAV